MWKRCSNYDYQIVVLLHEWDSEIAVVLGIDAGNLKPTFLVDETSDDEFRCFRERKSRVVIYLKKNVTKQEDTKVLQHICIILEAQQTWPVGKTSV